eukprot:4009781-Ditylum_brightwellii.AAC.1
MMQEQRDHLDANIINKFGANLVGPHNKCPKHSNMDTEPADVMEDTDALCCNRDACAPGLGGTGSA